MSSKPNMFHLLVPGFIRESARDTSNKTKLIEKKISADKSAHQVNIKNPHESHWARKLERSIFSHLTIALRTVSLKAWLRRVAQRHKVYSPNECPTVTALLETFQNHGHTRKPWLAVVISQTLLGRAVWAKAKVPPPNPPRPHLPNLPPSHERYFSSWILYRSHL